MLLWLLLWLLHRRLLVRLLHWLPLHWLPLCWLSLALGRHIVLLRLGKRRHLLGAKLWLLLLPADLRRTRLLWPWHGCQCRIANGLGITQIGFDGGHYYARFDCQDLDAQQRDTRPRINYNPLIQNAVNELQQHTAGAAATTATVVCRWRPGST